MKICCHGRQGFGIVYLVLSRLCRKTWLSCRLARRITGRDSRRISRKTGSPLQAGVFGTSFCFPPKRQIKKTPAASTPTIET
jgi:hypothetical protein